MYIVKGTTNKISTPLIENAEDPDSEWLVKLTNDFTGLSTEKVFAVSDISLHKERSSVFLITESIAENLSNGIVSLSPSGKWSYVIYEMAPSSPRNLDPADAIKIVKEGIAHVFDPTEGAVVVFDTDEDKNNPVFEG